MAWSRVLNDFITIFSLQKFALYQEYLLSTLESSSMADDAERLAWKFSKKQVMIGDFGEANFGDVPSRPFMKIRFVRLLATFVNVGGKDALGLDSEQRSRFFSGNAEASDAAEQINESNLGFSNAAFHFIESTSAREH